MSDDRLEKFWRDQYVGTETDNDASLLSGRCKVTRFESRSKGKGRLRSTPRTVTMVQAGETSFELRSRPRGRQDVLVDEILDGLPVPADLTPHRYLERRVEEVSG